MRERIDLETIHGVRDACLCLHTQRAARALARRFDLAFAPLGLTNGQFSLMARLCAPTPPTLGEAAAFLAMDRTTLTAALKALERRGWATVSRDPEDRRVKRLALTPEGRAVLAQAAAAWRRAHATLEAELKGVDADAFRRMSRAMT